MKKRYLILLGILFLKIDPVLSQAVNFPYQNTMKGTNPAHVVGVGNNQIFTANGVQLTDGTGYKSGAIVLDEVSFTADQGLTIEFEYDMYEGYKYSPNSNYGDGLCLFLYDATAPLNGLSGFAAGALAYYHQKTSVSPGLNKAYLAVAFDVFGSFKGLGENGVGNFASAYNNVTLRGAMRHAAIGADAVDANGNSTSYISNNPLIYNNPRFQGYPTLYSRNTNNPYPLSTARRGQYLDMDNNSATNVVYNNIMGDITNVTIRGGELNPAINSPNYRKAVVTLGPADPTIGGGYYITVDLYKGTERVRIVDRYHYKQNFFYKESENGSSVAVPHLNSKIYDLNATVPQNFKIGFGGSTGGATQYHLVKNLTVDLAYTPHFVPDFKKFCGSFADIDVFSNDYVYNGPIYGPPSQGNSSDDIDYNSFKFTNSDIVPYTELGSWNGDVLTYSIPNEGSWTYNKITGMVRFTPLITFSGNAEIFYTAKGTASLGGPFNQNDYYAVPEKIVVEKIICGGVINPQLPSGGVKRSNNL